MLAALDSHLDRDAQKARAAVFSPDAAVERYLELMLGRGPTLS
jgi:hypothetical protein